MTDSRASSTDNITCPVLLTVCSVVLASHYPEHVGQFDVMADTKVCYIDVHSCVLIPAGFIVLGWVITKPLPPFKQVPLTPKFLRLNSFLGGHSCKS